jgi:hypothetical protein
MASSVLRLGTNQNGRFEKAVASERSRVREEYLPLLDCLNKRAAHRQRGTEALRCHEMQRWR